MAKTEQTNKAPPVHVCFVCAHGPQKATYTLEEAQTKGFLKPTAYAFLDSGEGTPSSEAHAAAGALTCNNCGMTAHTFQKHGRFGCAKCHITFKTILQTALDELHQHAPHTGKVKQTRKNPPSGMHPKQQPEG